MFNRETFVSTINAYLPEPHASLLNGMLLGVSVRQSQEFYEAIKKVGLLHIVVLSGSNISLITELIGVATTRFGRTISILITTILLIFFISIVSLEAPILRAFLTAILTFVSVIFGKKSHALYLLLIAGIITHFIIPEAVTSISFQLSYAATLGMIYASQRKTKATGVRGYITENLRLSIIAQLFTGPIIFYYFREISVIAPISNVLIGWTLMPIMFFGLLTILLGQLSFFLGLIPALICYVLLSICIVVIQTLARIPFNFLKF